MPDKSRELIEPGLKQAPGDPGLLTVRGAARGQAGDTDGAIADGEAAHKVSRSCQRTLTCGSFLRTCSLALEILLPRVNYWKK